MRLKHLLGPLPNDISSGLITLIFVIFFVAMCWFVYRRERKGLYSEIEKLPLQED